MHDFIIDKGGFSKSAVSGKTDYLIIGSKLEDGREVTEGRKYRMAKEKGTKILTEIEFEKFGSYLRTASSPGRTPDPYYDDSSFKDVNTDKSLTHS